MSISQDRQLRAVGPAESPVDPAEEIPPGLTLDGSDSLNDVIDTLALAPFINGRQPWARTVRLTHVRADARLRPDGSRLFRSTGGRGHRALLAGGEGWTLRAVRWRGGSAEIEVTAVSDDLAKAVLEESTRDATTPPAIDESRVDVGFWHLGAHGAERTQRSIAASGWAEIRGNYSAQVASALERVMSLTREEVRGRLLLLHGPPGTGKTTALRALVRAWAKWCQAECVLDPERLFGNSGYLLEVAVSDDSDDKWQLLILEDCDELIRGEAKESTGQGLSRLLNLTDGMLGQGRDVMVVITTNEDLTRLHPAVIRPGRCLAQIEVGRLSQAEAAGWLRDAGRPGDVGPNGATLAELVALRDGETPATSPPAETGLYL